MAELQEITERIVAFRNARNWAQFHNPKDMALSLMLEAGEVAEHFQWKNKEEIAAHIVEHRESIGDELADVLYWVLLLSHDLGLDIKECFARKMLKNEAKYPVEKARDKHTKYDRL